MHINVVPRMCEVCASNPSLMSWQLDTAWENSIQTMDGHETGGVLPIVSHSRKKIIVSTEIGLIPYGEAVGREIY